MCVVAENADAQHFSSFSFPLDLDQNGENGLVMVFLVSILALLSSSSLAERYREGGAGVEGIGAFQNDKGVGGDGGERGKESGESHGRDNSFSL